MHAVPLCAADTGVGLSGFLFFFSFACLNESDGEFVDFLCVSCPHLGYSSVQLA